MTVNFETKILIAMGLLLVLLIGSCSYLANALKSEFGDCQGLQGAVDRVWTGEPCDEDSQKP